MLALSSRRWQLAKSTKLAQQWPAEAPLRLAGAPAGADREQRTAPEFCNPSLRSSLDSPTGPEKSNM